MTAVIKQRSGPEYITAVKKGATIFLLVLLVVTQTPLGQFFRFPLLIEHYKKHQKQDGVSLIAFLEDHYITSHKDADLPEDEQLPFKNVTLNSIGYAIVTPVFQANLVTALPAEKKITFSDIYSPQQHLATIFHPPRL